MQSREEQCPILTLGVENDASRAHTSSVAVSEFSPSPPGKSMGDIIVRSRLFLGAYSPLFCMLAIRFSDAWLRWTCGALGAFGAASLIWLVMIVPRRVGADSVVLSEVNDNGGAVSGFLTSYLLPFLTISAPTCSDIAAYSVFLFVAWLVYIRSNMVEVNPTLYLLGYRVLSIETSGGFAGFVVTKRRLRAGDTLRKTSLSENVLIEK